MILSPITNNWSNIYVSTSKYYSNNNQNVTSIQCYTHCIFFCMDNKSITKDRIAIERVITYAMANLENKLTNKFVSRIGGFFSLDSSSNASKKAFFRSHNTYVPEEIISLCDECVTLVINRNNHRKDILAN